MDRRHFLKAASWGALAHLRGTSPLRAFAQLAQSSSSTDYKALVCLFLRGGNDSNNLLLPLESRQFSYYQQARGSLALSQSSLLPLSSVPYALHPAFVNLQRAVLAGSAAMIANVGPLVQPTTMAQYQSASVALPPALMSHEDQQQAWESGSYVNGTGPGWGGMVADTLTSRYNSSNLPMVTLLGPATNFGLGKSTAPFTASANSQPAGFWCSANNSCPARLTAMQQLITFNNGVNLLQADEQIYQHSFEYNAFFNNVLQSATPLKTIFPSSNPMSPALVTIATMIQLRQQIGASRQIFFINAGGFDTHADQSASQPTLFSQLDQAVEVFSQAMQELGVFPNVTLFTASDFARTLQYNGSAGTDHAWGGHHFVVGGAVKNGQLYGTFPSLQLNGPDDLDGTGRWLPSTSLSQYAATLASWFGVPSAALPAILPGLSNFSNQNLGFI